MTNNILFENEEQYARIFIEKTGETIFYKTKEEFRAAIHKDADERQYVIINDEKNYIGFNNWPAIKTTDGMNAYYKNGRPHRKDGPALYCEPDGSEAWYWNGLQHRVDGPAETFPSGKKEYWLCGEKVSKERHEYLIGKYDYAYCFDDCIYLSKKGTDIHFKRIYHCDEGPAQYWADGTKQWLKDNKLHREDGPAVLNESTGQEGYYLDDKYYVKQAYDLEMDRRTIANMVRRSLSSYIGQKTNDDTVKDISKAIESTFANMIDTKIEQVKVRSVKQNGADLNIEVSIQIPIPLIQIKMEVDEDLLDKVKAEPISEQIEEDSQSWWGPGMAIAAAGLVGIMFGEKKEKSNKVEHKQVSAVNHYSINNVSN